MDSYVDFAFSQQGYSHQVANPPKVCQDSSLSYSDEKVTILALADGHGGSDYPRTDRGSKYAVEAACMMIRKFVYHYDWKDSSLSEDLLIPLSQSILSMWHEKVDSDLAEYPFEDAELANVSAKYCERYQYQADKYGCKAYGTTLIAVCITSDYWFGLQIGDGKCVAFDTDGRAEEPIPWDEQCHENVTTSICDNNAAEEFRFAFGGKNTIPAAIFIGSDGVDDSYPYPPMDKVKDLYASVLQIYLQQGESKMKADFEPYLSIISRKGSGDDISVCGCFLRDPQRLRDVLEAYKGRLYEIQTLQQEINVHESAILKAQQIQKQKNELLKKGEKYRKQYESLCNKRSDCEDGSEEYCRLTERIDHFASLLQDNESSLAALSSDAEKAERILKKKQSIVESIRNQITSYHQNQRTLRKNLSGK